MGARMTGTTATSGEPTPEWGPVVRPGATVLHAWADVRALGDATAQLVRLAMVRDTGWLVVLALPDGAAWNELVTASAGADLPVIRWSPPARRPDRRWTSTIARVRWLSTSGVTAVHAHDDAAADQWRSAARGCAVPLIWDVDQQAPRVARDGRRLAATSYLITVRGGSRLAGRRVLPPNQPGAGPRTGEWFDLAEDGDLAARLAAPSAATVCEVYSCLTGQRPAPAAARAEGTTTAALSA